MLTLRVSLDVDTSRLEHKARQLPFAMARALNATAKDAQAAERARMAEAFTLRRKLWAERSVKITHFATKSALFADVAISPPGAPERADIFGKFEFGGIKRPTHGGRSLAVPVLGSLVRPSARAIVRKENRPRALIARGQLGARPVFVRRAPDGTGGIFARVGAGARARARLLFAFVPSVPVDTRLHFRDTAVRAIGASWRPNFETAWAEALRTAR